MSFPSIAARQGLEPQLSVPDTGVLPLDERAAMKINDDTVSLLLSSEERLYVHTFRRTGKVEDCLCDEFCKLTLAKGDRAKRGQVHGPDIRLGMGHVCL